MPTGVMRPTQLVAAIALAAAIGTVVPWAWQIKQQERAEQEAAAAWAAARAQATAAIERIDLPDAYEPVACDAVDVPFRGRCWTTAAAPGDAVVDLAAAFEAIGLSPMAPRCTPDVKRDLPDQRCSVDTPLLDDYSLGLDANRDYAIVDDEVTPTGTTTVSIPFPTE